MNIINHLEKSKLTFVFCLILLLSIIAFSIIFRQGGYSHPESQSFILNYLDNRPVTQKIFDIQKNDWGFYQARELSYFFDMIDAHFIQLSVRFGFPHFYSLTHFVGLLLTLIILYLIYFKLLKFKSLIIFTLLTALFLTAPATFFSGIFFRTSKILTIVFFTSTLYFYI